MITSVNQILKLIQSIAPFENSDSWDNTGLIIGNGSKIVNRVLFALDLTEEILDEAIEEGFELIVTHHPIIFNPIHKITSDSRIGRLILKTIQNDLSVISAHTNLDKSFDNGINRYIADQYDLKNLEILIPETDTIGYGVVGTLSQPLDFDFFIEKTKSIFNTGHIKASNINSSRKVSKLAISSGASADFIKSAIASRSDVFITSDLKYHEYQSVIGTDLILVDVGHYESESIFLEALKDHMDALIQQQDYDVFTKVTETEKPIVEHL